MMSDFTIYKIKVLEIQVDYFIHACIGRFDTEKVSGIWGTCSTFSSRRYTRRRASLFEISLVDYRDGSLVPRYSKPKVSWAWRGWILRFIQSKTTASPVIRSCFRSAIHPSRSRIWLPSINFFFHPGLITGGPGAITGRVFSWFPI